MIFAKLLHINNGRKYSWRRRDKILLLEQLEMFISAGLSASRGLEIIENGQSGKRDRGKRGGGKLASLENVRKEVESGGLLSRALLDHVGLSKSLVSIIEHGERVGGLALSLKSAHDLLVREDELTKKCLSAMMYPIVIGTFAIILTMGLMRGVVPQIVPMLSGMHVELPVLTKITIWLSGAAVSFGLHALLAALSLCIAAIFAYKKLFIFKRFIHNTIHHAPLIGDAVYSYALSIFLRSLGTLISSGMPIAVAYSESVETVSFEPLKMDISHGTKQVSGGSPLQDIFVNKNIPAHVPMLISAGETSGSLGESLIRAASIIDSDLENTLKRLTSLIEPILMIGVGGVVGAIALSIMMPIYEISRILQHAH